MDNSIQEGLAALKAGNKSLARTLFRKAIQQNHDDTQAWLGLSAAVDSDFEKVQCLQTIIKIDPDNRIAKTALDQLVGRLFHGDNLNLENPNLGSTINPVSPDLKVENQENTSDKPQNLPRPDSPQPALRADRSSPNASNDTDPFEILRSRYAALDNLQKPERMPSLGEDQPKIQPVPVKKSYLIVPDKEPGEIDTFETFSRSDNPILSTNLEHQPVKKNRILKNVLIIAGVFLGFIFIGSLILIGVAANGPQHTPTPEFMAVAKPVLASELTLTATNVKLVILPPTLEPTATLLVTKTPIPTPTYPQANRTIQARFKTIQTQVADLRGLPVDQENVPVYPITKPQAQEYFTRFISGNDFVTQLENRKKALVLLGLVNASFDMYGEVINHMVDNIGGFYAPGSKEIFIVSGLGVSGVDFMVYAHEFDHALVDQNYDIYKSGVYPECKFDSQHCRAIEALFEGDAELLMEQWARQYFSQKDLVQALNSPQPFYEPDNQTLPPYLVQDALFPYIYGTRFVKGFYQNGSWAAVDKLYGRLPISTTQIMHPDKYISNEQPVDMPDKTLAQRLGEGWSKVADDSLGEWMTYLMLAYNSDKTAQVDQRSANVAAAGWDGDHFQVFESKATHAQVLAAHWSFDTSPDAGEFSNIMLLMLENRNRGNRLEWLGRDCWQNNGQLTCFFSAAKQGLWLVGPDKDTIDVMLSAYPDFVKK